MKYLTSFFLIALIFGINVKLSAQDQSIKKLHDEAVKLMIDYKYGAAKEIYDKLLILDPDNPQLNFEAGVCVFKGSFNKSNSIPYFSKASDYYQHKKTSLELYYWMGKAYQFDQNFVFALGSYNTFLAYLGDAKSAKELIEEVERYIEQCEQGRVQIEEAAYTTYDRSDPNDRNTSKYYIDQHRFVTLENMGNHINSNYSDYGPIFMNNNKTLVYTSRNENSTGGELYYDDEYYEDIYVTNLKDGEWQNPIKIEDSETFGNAIKNTDKHESTIALSPDGNTMFIYSENQVSSTTFDNGKWQKLEKISSNLENAGNQVTSVYPSPNGERIYFVSNGSDSYGGRDIYYSELQDDGQWGEMHNRGPGINSEFDESSPFLSNDSTMYFSSQGHTSIGGYDVFLCKMKHGVWQDPVNLNIPINTPFDEVNYKLAQDRAFAYYASDRSEGYGKKDIFIIRKGFDFEADSLVAAQLDQDSDNIVDSAYTEEYADSLSLASNEEQLNEMDESQESMQGANEGEDNLETSATEESEEANGEESKTEGVSEAMGETATQESPKQMLTMEEKITDEPYTDKVPTKEDIANVSKFYDDPNDNFETQIDKFIFEERAHFQFDRSYLTEYSSNKIQRIIDFIDNNPDKEFVVRLSGHTDTRGDENYNMRLSKKRVQSVEEFLTSKNVRAELQTKYYGENKPITEEYAEVNSIYNRRVQVRLYYK